MHRRRGTLLAIAVAVGLLLLGAGSAKGQYFGRNKVPRETREWRVLQSPHFDLHFYEAERALAETALRVAERSYDRLRRLYQHDVERRIPVILYASQSEFRETRAVASLIGEGTGGITESYKRRVIVPSTGSYAELDHVLTHELVHAFQLDLLQRSGPGRSAQPIRWTPPLWVMEGLAEYLSIPGTHAHNEMWMRDAVLHGTLLDLETLAYVGDLRVYRFGQSAIAHIAERFGDEVLGPWLRSMARRRSVDAGTRESLGLTLAKLSEDWHATLRRRYLPDLARGVPVESVAHRLTNHGESLASLHITPAVSPDGGEVVYVADDTPYADLYLASALDGSRRERLIRGERSEEFESLRYYRTTIDWSPDGDRLALIVTGHGADRLVIYDVRAQRVLAEHAFDFDELLSPCWSPDGAQLAFVGLREGYARLYRTTPAGAPPRAIGAGPAAAFQPAWSPDGTRLAYVTDRDFGSLSAESTFSPWKIALLDVESGRETVLPGMDGKNLNPQWFPDGRHLLFISDRSGIANLYIRDLETQTDYVLTDFVEGISGIAPISAAVSLSDNGRRAVFSVYAHGGWDLFALQDPLVGLAGRRRWTSPRPAGQAERAAPGQASEEVTAARAGPTAGPESSAAPAASGGREVGIVGPPAAPIEEIDLAELFRATAALPCTLGVEERGYRPALSLDVAQAGGGYVTGYGALAQSVLIFSDMLGHRQLAVAADVSGSLAEGDYYLGYFNHHRRASFGFAFYQAVSGYGYGTLPGYPQVYQKRLVRGVGGRLWFPFSRRRRLELGVDLVQEQRFLWECSETTTANLWRCGWRDEHTNDTYIVPEVAYVHDSALFGATGPLSGRRTRVALDLLIGEREARGVTFDHRQYWNVRKRYAFATRVVFSGEWGADREALAFGGPYSLRGYTEHPLYGTKVFFTNLEFRFPFIDVLHIAWPLRLTIGGLRGALFFDLGGAWDHAHQFRAVRSGDDGGRLRLDDLHAAAGVRVAVNLGFLILRWDLARRTDLAGWIGEPRGEVSMGWEF